MNKKRGWETRRIKKRLGLISVPKIPSLCLCGCNEIVWNGHEWISGHNTIINNPMNNIESRTKLQGKNHPLYGIGHTLEACEKISKNHADVSGSKNPMYDSHRCGELNPNWQGGISFDPYCEKWTSKLREEVRIRFDHKCFICGKDQSDNMTKTGKKWRLSVHHIDYDKQQGCKEKSFILAPLCICCHPKTNKNREEWKNKLVNKLSEIER